jgi:leader peptidase (prepilin peptidase)/N-methyltransferase
VTELADTFPQPLAAAWLTLLGAVVGSFLNVVIARVPRGESVVRPRSRCPRCGATIAWYDNVPVLSWVLLRARCRACAAPIPARYPLVELLGAAAGLLAWRRHGLSAAALAELAFAAVLVALAFIDLDTWLLPHLLTWPLVAFGLAMSAFELSAASLLSSVWGAVIGFAAFALVSVVGEKVFKKEALGFGDVWLLAGLGAWLGVRALLPVVLLASLQGSVVGIALLLLGRSEPGPEPAHPAAGEEWVPPRHAVPFGPFLALGALEWLYLSSVLARLVPALEVFR